MRPKALRDSTIWLTPVRLPISTKRPNTPMPTALPSTSTRIVSVMLIPQKAIPRVPRIQLMGAMLAPHQIQNW